MVTLCTLHPYPQEQLGDIFNLVFRFFDAFVPGNGRVIDHGSRCREQFPHKLIVGLVRQQAVTNPGMEGEVGDDITRVVPAILQQIGPFTGKEVGIVGTLQQIVDDPITLVGGSAGQERGCFLGCWQAPADIERHASQECRIIANG